MGRGGYILHGFTAQFYFITNFYNAINNGRAPLYHRLDVTLTHSFSMWGALAKFFLTVVNAYANKNSFSISFANSYPALPTIIPVFGFGLEF
jgi:hypothetical protein